MSEPAPTTDRASSVLASLSRIWAQAAGGVLVLAASLAMSPAAFGEFVLAASVFAFLAIFAGHGIYEYVLKEIGSRSAPATAGLVNFAAAIAACAAAYLISLHIDALFDSTAVGENLRLLAPALLLQAGNLVLESVLLRRGRVGRVSVTMIAADTLGLAVALAALARGAGPFALVLQKLTREAVLLAGYALSDRWRAPAAPSFVEAGAMVRFAAAIMGARLIGQGAMTAFDMLIGFFLSPAAAGLFRLANRLIGMAFDILHYPLRTLLWVKLPPLQDDHAAFARTAFTMAATFAVAMSALVGGMAAVAAPAFDLVFAPEWHDAAPIVAIMGAARLMAWPGTLLETLMAMRGQVRSLFVWNVLNWSSGVALLAAFAPYGLMAAAGSQLIAAPVALALTTPFLVRASRTPFRDWAWLWLRLALITLAMAGAVLAALWAAPLIGVDGWARLIAAIVLGATVFVALAARFAPEGFSAYADAARGAFRRLRRAAPARR